MKTKILLFLLLIGVVNQRVVSQEIPQLTSKDSIVQSSWIVGLGINIVDDSGNVFNDFFDIEERWNSVSHPSRISIGKYFKSGVGIEAIGTYNKYKVGKLIDGTINTVEKDYLGLDARLSYDLNKIIGETGWFDPYVGIGVGYTDANNEPRGTYNAVVGFRTWFSDHWGLDFNSSGKWAMGTDATNHIQHAAGVLYQFDVKKELSAKGLEKLAMIQEMEKEQQRVQDSISAAKEAEEQARALAEQLAKQKEEAMLAAAAEKERIDVENSIRKEVKDIGNVYFRLNSSYLSKNDKTVLDQLAALMDKHANIIIKITAHADARGSEEYNLWLSEKRLKRSVDYLLSIGVDAQRLEHEALGENNLTNECVDGVYCPENKHSENRRSEFIVIKF